MLRFANIWDFCIRKPVSTQYFQKHNFFILFSFWDENVSCCSADHHPWDVPFLTKSRGSPWNSTTKFHRFRVFYPCRESLWFSTRIEDAEPIKFSCWDSRGTMAFREKRDIPRMVVSRATRNIFKKYEKVVVLKILCRHGNSDTKVSNIRKS